MLDQLDTRHMGEVYKRELAASQIDWAAVQQDNQPRFLEAARHAFAKLDIDGDGVWSCQEILDCLQSRLAPTEVCSWMCGQYRQVEKSSHVTQDLCELISSCLSSMHSLVYLLMYCHMKASGIRLRRLLSFIHYHNSLIHL